MFSYKLTSVCVCLCVCLHARVWGLGVLMMSSADDQLCLNISSGLPLAQSSRRRPLSAQQRWARVSIIGKSFTRSGN